MNSRRRAVDKTLAPVRISPSEAKELLEHLANFPSFLGSRTQQGPPLQLAQYRTGARAVARLFPKVFTEFQAVIGDDGEDFLVKAMIGLGEHIREAWREPDLGARGWMICELRRLWQRLYLKARQVSDPGDRLEDFIPPEHLERVKAQSEMALKKVERYTFWGWWPDPPPAQTLFEQVMIHFQRALPQARYCANPDCVGRYFFAQRRSQKYHKECAWYGQQQAKRRYWHDKGKKARAQQIQAKKKRRR
ncbi:MAG: hypothetical protein V3S55_02010 [Nitrospiraceae bacterium]